MPITYDDPGTLYDETDITYDGALVGVGPSVTSILQIVDPDNLTTVLYDLNDQTGVNSQLYGNVATFLITDMDLGVPALKDTGASDIAKPLAFNRQATAQMQLRIRIKPVSNDYDDLVLAVGTLASHLAAGCVMRWQPTGANAVRYIDVLPSPTPVLLHGQDAALFDALIQVDTPQGVTLSMERLAYTRGDALVASVNLLQNSTPGRDSNADGTPDNWTILSTPTLTLDATQNSSHVVAGAASRGLFQDTAAASVSVGQTVTFSADVKVTSGTAALTIDWRTSGGASISTVSQTFTNTRFIRVYATGVAPATTDHVRATIQSSGGASTFDWRYAQCETGTTGPPTAYRVRAQTLQDDPAASGFGQLISVFNPCDAAVPCQFEVSSPDATPKIVEADFALVSDRNIPGARNLYDFLNGPNYAQADASGNGWTRTLSTNVTSVVDATASGGNAAQYAPATDAAAALPYKILSETRTTLLDSLRGRTKVYAAVKGASSIEWNLQLAWGPGATAGEQNDAVTHDLSQTTAAFGYHYVYIDLGDIELPREKNVAISQLTLDLSAWQSPTDTGTLTAHSTLNVDHLAFVPTDDSAFVTVPGASVAAVKGKYLTTPDQLGAPTSDPAWTAGLAKSGGLNLNANHEAGGLGDNTNGYYSGTSGTRHQVIFDITWANLTISGSDIVVGIADLTTNVRYGGGTFLQHSGSWTVAIDLADTPGDNYQPMVGCMSFASSSGHVTINQITVATIPYLGQNARIRSDPGSQPSRSLVEQTDSSGNLGLELDATGVPFWLPPGLSLVYVKVFDAANVGYNENQWVLGRTFTVTPTLYPRYWG